MFAARQGRCRHAKRSDQELQRACLAEPRGPQRLGLQHLGQLIDDARGRRRPAQAQARRQELAEAVQPANSNSKSSSKQPARKWNSTPAGGQRGAERGRRPGEALAAGCLEVPRWAQAPPPDDPPVGVQRQVAGGAGQARHARQARRAVGELQAGRPAGAGSDSAGAGAAPAHSSHGTCHAEPMAIQQANAPPGRACR